MKKLFLLAGVITIAFASNAGTYTVYGKNNGTIVTTSPGQGGGTTTTTKIDCDNWYNYTCYTWSDTPPPGPSNPGGPTPQYGVLQAFGPNGTRTVEGYLVNKSVYNKDSRNSVHTVVQSIK